MGGHELLRATDHRGSCSWDHPRAGVGRRGGTSGELRLLAAAERDTVGRSRCVRRFSMAGVRRRRAPSWQAGIDRETVWYAGGDESVGHELGEKEALDVVRRSKKARAAGAGRAEVTLTRHRGPLTRVHILQASRPMSHTALRRFVRHDSVGAARAEHTLRRPGRGLSAGRLRRVEAANMWTLYVLIVLLPRSRGRCSPPVERRSSITASR